MLISFISRLWLSFLGFTTFERIAGAAMLAIGYFSLEQPNQSLLRFYDINHAVFAALFLAAGGIMLGLNWDKHYYTDSQWDTSIKVILVMPLMLYALAMIELARRGVAASNNAVVYTAFYFLILRSLYDLERLAEARRFNIELRGRLAIQDVKEKHAARSDAAVIEGLLRKDIADTP